MQIPANEGAKLQSKANAPDVVLSASYGVGPDFVRTFLKTFRAVNQSARIILLVWERGPLRSIADEYNAELDQDRWFCRHIPRIKIRYKQFSGATVQKRVRVTELFGRSTRLAPRLAFLLPEILTRSLVSLAVARFFHVRDILSREEFGQVLLSDSRDVFFQGDPFASPVELELAQESNRFGFEPLNDAWFADGFGAEALSTIEGRHVLCSGTILGSRKSVLDHVRRMCDHVKRLRTWKHGGIDQALHNFVVSNLMDSDGYTISTNERGRISTINFETDLRIRHGYIVDAEGRPIPIIHQYDRIRTELRDSLRMLRI